MSDQPDPGNAERRELREDELVERLAPDIGEARPLTVLPGILSRTQRDGYFRLYLTYTFDHYVEIAEEDIIYSKPIPASASSVGGTLLWIRSSAPLQYTQITSRQIQAEFLKGSITANLRAGTAPLGAGMAQAVYTHNPACPGFTDWCESDVQRYCPTTFGCFTQAACGGTVFECLTDNNCVPGTIHICH